ncbi:MAG TPA: PQQ-binding-like beta-propeller repeat protein [Acidobacteriota bacterium]
MKILRAGSRMGATSASRILLFMFITGLLHAGEWLRFRGPNGSGVSETTGLPAEFGASKNLVWKIQVPFGRSSPVVAGDRVFLTASEGDKLITLSLDRKTGKTLWRREVLRTRHMPIYKGNDPASPTPVSDGKNVYAFFAELGLISYTPDGKERWRLPLGPFNSFYGLGASPILAGDTLLMVCDQRTNSFLIAVNAADGRVRWKVSRANPVEAFSTPVIYKREGGTSQVLVFGSHALDAYAVDTGERLWWVGQVGYFAKGVPVVGRDAVYVSAPGSDQPEMPPFQEQLKKYDTNRDGVIQLDEMKSEPYITEHFGWVDSDGSGSVDEREFNVIRLAAGAGHGLTAIRPGGKGDVTGSNVLWRLKKGYPNIPAPLLYKDVLYLVKTGGIITALNPANGEVLKAGRTESAMEEYFSSPVAADDKVFLVSESGKVTVLKAGANWEILAVNDLDEDCWATPAVADGRIYIRTRSSLYCFGR